MDVPRWAPRGKMFSSCGEKAWQEEIHTARKMRWMMERNIMQWMDTAKEGGLYQDPAGRERRGAEGGGSTTDVTDETDFVGLL